MDEGHGGQQQPSTFNQFEGKSSTYDFSLYTSSLDEKKVTEEQKAVAKRVEHELLQKGASFDDDGEDEHDSHHQDHQSFDIDAPTATKKKNNKKQNSKDNT